MENPSRVKERQDELLLNRYLTESQQWFNSKSFVMSKKQYDAYVEAIDEIIEADEIYNVMLTDKTTQTKNARKVIMKYLQKTNVPINDFPDMIMKSAKYLHENMKIDVDENYNTKSCIDSKQGKILLTKFFIQETY